MNQEQNNLNKNNTNNQVVQNNNIIGYDKQTGKPIYGNQNNNIQNINSNQSISQDKKTVIKEFILKNKKIIIILGIVIIVLISSIIIYLTTNKKEENKVIENNNDSDKNIVENTNVNNKEDLYEEYPGYDFIDVEVYDESTNGNILHEKQNWIEYDVSTELSIKYEKNSCTSEEIDYKFTIENGKLTVTDFASSNLDKYTFNQITNVKSIMRARSLSCEHIVIILLTNDGKIYYYNSYDIESGGTATMKFDFTTLESKFKLVKSNYSFDKIGQSYYPWGMLKVGAHTTTGEEVTVYPGDISQPYDNTTYSALGYHMSGVPIMIGLDNSIMWYPNNNNNKKYITDENLNKIYINYGFSATDINDSYGYNNYYIIDRQGYLYTIGNDGNSTVANKYSPYKVEYIGVDNTGVNYSSIILVLENGEKIEIEKDYEFGVE